MAIEDIKNLLREGHEITREILFFDDTEPSDTLFYLDGKYINSDLEWVFYKAFDDEENFKVTEETSAYGTITTQTLHLKPE